MLKNSRAPYKCEQIANNQETATKNAKKTRKPKKQKMITCHIDLRLFSHVAQKRLGPGFWHSLNKWETPSHVSRIFFRKSEKTLRPNMISQVGNLIKFEQDFFESPRNKSLIGNNLSGGKPVPT